MFYLTTKYDYIIHTLILLMKNFKIKNTANIILENYFLLMAISALGIIFTGAGYVESIILPLIIYVVFFYSKRKSGSFDLIIYLILLLTIVTWLINDYDQKYFLIFRSLMAQTCFIFAYFIGKNIQNKYHYVILEKAYWPFVICCILGIYFYFFPPNWYLEYAISNSGDYDSDSSAFLEYFRLRSIFSHTYYMAYFCFFYGTYLVYKKVILNDKSRFINWTLSIIVITSLLAMMRGPFSCFLLSSIILFFYSSIRKRNLANIFKLFVIIGGVLLIAISVFNNLSYAQQEFLSSKVLSVTEDSSELIKSRSDNDIEYNLFGDGVGKHASYVDKISKNTVLADNEYNKISVEYGLIGTLLFVLLIGMSIVKCLLNFRYLLFEFCCILMLAICMTGADPISTGNKHCLLFYMILGYVSAFNRKDVILIRDKKR